MRLGYKTHPIMTKDQFFKLADKYNQGTANSRELALIEKFCQDIQVNDISEEWSLSQQEETRLRLIKGISRSIDNIELEFQIHKRRKRSVLFRVAASIALIATLSWIFFKNQPEQSTSEIGLVTKTTSNGQKATITLADGSVVKLNAESSITFPEFFTNENRIVTLTGEAFFDVKRDPSRPFIVQSENLSTKVLGTSFNINSYPENEEIKVTLATGKVEIMINPNPELITKPWQERLVLAPGQQASFNRNTHDLKSGVVDLEKSLAWSKEIIFLDGTTLEETANILERWFDTTFDFKNESIKKCVISGEFTDDQLPNILENIQFLTGVKYEILPDNKVILSGQTCN